MNSKEKAIFGAGCFWSVEMEFSHVNGVISTKVGYSGGDNSYKKVGDDEIYSGKTGHAEVIEITFDPTKVSYENLLDKFFMIHDSTTLNRQGPDFGNQYRSIILYLNEGQRKKAEKKLKEWQKKFDDKIVTEIKPFIKFYPAEEYHQKFLEKRGLRNCRI